MIKKGKKSSNVVKGMRRLNVHKPNRVSDGVQKMGVLSRNFFLSPTVRHSHFFCHMYVNSYFLFSNGPPGY